MAKANSTQSQSACGNDSAHPAGAAPARFSDFPALDPSTEIVVCTPSFDIAEYQGTRAALEAEGVIPAGTDWPKGFDTLYWGDAKFSYWLRRTRPEGHNGPRKQFMHVDWWMLRCDPVNMPSHFVRTAKRIEKELADYVLRHSREGMAAWGRQFDRYLEAKKDEKFQAFKSLIPGIQRPKRGRRTMNAGQLQGSSA